MALIVDTQKYLDTVRQLLQEGQTNVPVPVTGTSMCPFLHPGDIACLNRITRTPSRGDIVLFTRPDGSYVLHRVFKVRKDGSFLLLGDNQLLPEPVPGMERIHATVTSVRVKDKNVSPSSLRWWFYAHLWSRPARRIIGRLRK